MGERQRPKDTTPLKPDLGQRALAEWNGEKRNRPSLPFLSQILQPTRSIGPFQRRMRASHQEQATGAAQVARFRVIVPAGEAWRVIALQARNAGIGAIAWTVSVTNAALPTAFDAIFITRKAGPAGSRVLLYPGVVSRPVVPSDVDYDYSETWELFEGDQVQVLQIGGADPGAVVQQVDLRYELIPPRRSLAPGEPWTSAAV